MRGGGVHKICECDVAQVRTSVYSPVCGVIDGEMKEHDAIEAHEF